MTTYTLNFGLALPDFRQGPWHDQVNNDLIKIDALLFSALSGANVAIWENDIEYSEGQSVVDEADASVWLCTIAHTSALAPTTFAEDRAANPTYWARLLTGFAPRGEWANDTNYFPYDLVYVSDLGIMALCTLKHTSNPTGNIKDDELYWSFLIDMSESDLSSAVAVTYDNSTSGIPYTNVQLAIDYVDSINDTQASQIVALNNVNIAQGNAIAEKLSFVSPNTLTDPQKDQVVADIGALSVKGGQTVTGGFRITPYNLGTIPIPFTPNSLLGNYQYGTNLGALVWNVPTADCAVDILVTNGATAGIITFPGYTYNSANAGDPLTTTAGHKFLISIRRIAGISTLIIKALQ